MSQTSASVCAHTLRRAALQPCHRTAVGSCRRNPLTATALALLACAWLTSGAQAQLYWDPNGATAGSGTPATGLVWDAGTNWTTDSTGAAATTGWVNGSAVIFSAGTDVAGTWGITINGTVQTNSITFETDAAIVHNISGGTIDIGTGGLVINAAGQGTGSGRSKTISSNITGSGGIVIAASGDTSASGNGSNTIVLLSGTGNDFTGDVTITSGMVGYASNFGNAANKIVLNGGGIVGNTTGELNRNIQVGANGGAIRTYGAATLTLSGVISGSGEIRRTDGGTVILTGANTHTGAWNLQRGTLQVGSGTQTSNLISGTSGVTIGDASAAATLAYHLDTSFTLTTPITFTNAGSMLRFQGLDAGDVLTINSALGTSASGGNLRVNSGGVTLASGANVKLASVQLASTPAGNAAAVVGTLTVESGASLETRYINVGDGTGTAGAVIQTGGSVTIVGGGTGFRLGHWTNTTGPAFSTYTMTGGLLDATGMATNAGIDAFMQIGFDGSATMTVGGGASTATVKAHGIQLDVRSPVATDSTLAILSNGLVEIGAGGTAAGAAADRIILTGGTIRSMASATWGAALDTTSTGTLDIVSGSTVTLTGNLSGAGTLTKTGAGTLVLSGTKTGTGTLNFNEGVLAGTGTLNSGSTLTLNGGVINPGAIIPGNVSGSAIGTLTVGSMNLNAGQIVFGLHATNTATGGTTNDLIAATGPVTINGSAIVLPSFNGSPAAGTYTLITSTGTITGTPTLSSLVTGSNSNLTLSLTNQGSSVTLTAAGQAKSLTWNGGGSSTWDLNASQLWQENAALDSTFKSFDSVTFNDSGITKNVTLTGTLLAGAVTVNNTAGNDYAFSGTGSIASGSLTKSGAGKLTLLTTNTYSGSTIINGGTVAVGNGGATGTLGGSGAITVSSGAALEFNRSDDIALDRAFTASGGTLVKNGGGNLTIQGFFLLPSNVVVNAGTLTFVGGSFGGNRLEGAGTFTINAGGTIVLSAGSAHALGGSNGSMTDSVVINGGTLTANQEQYLRQLTLKNGGTINGTAEVRVSTSGNAWLVTTDTPGTATAASTIASTLNMVDALNLTVENVTESSAADLVISGLITGNTSFNKAGAGTVLINSANTNNAQVVVNGGVLQLGSATALGFGGAIGNTAVGTTTVSASGAVDLNGQTIQEAITLNGGALVNENTSTAGVLGSGVAGIRITAAGSGYTSAPTVAFSGGGGSGATATTALSSGTVGTITTTASGSGYTTAPTVTLNGGAGTGATATAIISSLNLIGTGNTVGGAGALNINGVITGDGGYTKVGTGTTTVGNTGSSFTGNITVQAGTLTANGATSSTTTSTLGQKSSARTITVESGGTLHFASNNVFGGGGTAVSSMASIIVNAGGQMTVANYNAVGAIILNGGTLSNNRTTSGSSHDGFEFKGPVSTGGSTMSTISSTGPSGNHLAGSITFTVAEATAGIDLMVSTVLRNGSQDMSGVAGSLTKEGTGTMALTAANLYTGGTTVNAGTLMVENTSGSGTGTGAVTVNANGVLAGHGAITTNNAAIVVNGKLSVGGPGDSIDSLDMNLHLGAGTSTITFNGTVELDIFGQNDDLFGDEHGADLFNDTLKFNTTSSVILGGVLVVNDASLDLFNDSTSWNEGDSWQLFDWANVGSVSGAFTGYVLPTLSAGLQWDTSQLASSGVIAIAVPEPSRGMLVLIGLGALLMRRQRSTWREASQHFWLAIYEWLCAIRERDSGRLN